ncbi:hypothetical protein WMF47_06800 [Sorangium sp. So ce861]
MLPLVQRRDGVEDRVVLELGEPLAALDAAPTLVTAQREERGLPGAQRAGVDPQGDLRRERIAVRGEEDLHPRVSERGDDIAGEAGALRVEVGLGLVPEQVCVLGERSVHEQVGYHRELAVAFGGHRHLHVASRVAKIEAPFPHHDLAAELALDGLEELRRSTGPERLQPKRDAEIEIGPVERRFAVEPRFDEPREDREYLSRRDEKRPADLGDGSGDVGRQRVARA